MTGAAPGATLDRLLHATQELIAEDGWSGATTRRVADRAGVNPGVVHYHASSIDELRRRAVVAGLRSYFEDSMPVVTAGSTARSVDVGPLFAALRPTPEKSLLLRLLHESLSAASRDPELRNVVAGMLGTYRSTIAAALRASGVEDAEDVAATVSAAVDGYVLQCSLDPSISAGPIVRTLERLCLPTDGV